MRNPVFHDLVGFHRIDPLAVEPDFSAADRNEARNGAHYRALARAIRPHQHHKFIFPDMEVDVPEHLDVPIAGIYVINPQHFYSFPRYASMTA